jgi:hypothetical protein
MQVAGGESDLDSGAPIDNRLLRASEGDLKVATHRSGLIRQYLDSGSMPPTTEVSIRTFFDGLDAIGRPRQRTEAVSWACCHSAATAAIALRNCRKRLVV